MANELQSSRPEITPEQIKEWSSNPLLQLPHAFRAIAWEWWSAWQHVLPTQLALCTRLRWWIEKGLTAEDLKTAFERLNEPERMAEMRFAGDLLAALAQAVADIRHTRRIEEQMRKDRTEKEEAEKNPMSAEARQRLKDFRNGIADAFKP